MAKKKSLPPILNSTHYDLAAGALQRVKDLAPVIAAAKKLGVDTSSYEDAARSVQEWHDNFMQTWFPNGKPK